MALHHLWSEFDSRVNEWYTRNELWKEYRRLQEELDIRRQFITCLEVCHVYIDNGGTTRQCPIHGENVREYFRLLPEFQRVAREAKQAHIEYMDRLQEELEFEDQMVKGVQEE